MLSLLQDMFSFTLHPATLGTELGVAHADDIAYLWDIFSLNSGTGLYDLWWSEADKLNSRRCTVNYSKNRLVSKLLQNAGAVEQLRHPAGPHPAWSGL